ncbi:hypothetical protein [Pseudomonas mosselii]|uniref:hypothetical protein n=1 Tax=Pseudomonas mosselii TaxID=78327 RepID=UPI001F3AE790|nr:hypothetical protein [Pseudomonas mosselii]
MEDLNPYRAQHKSAVTALALAVSGLQEQYELYGMLHKFDEAQAKGKLQLTESNLAALKPEHDLLATYAHAYIAGPALAKFVNSQRSLVDRLLDAVTGKKPPVFQVSEADEALHARRLARFEELKAEIAMLEGLATTLRYDLQFHSTLNWVETDTDHATYRSQIARLEPAVLKLASDVARFDEHLSGPLQKRDEFRARLHEAEQGLAEAARFDESYQKARSGSKERAEIQGQCQRYFGLSDTSRALRQKSSQVADLKRELAKAEDRLQTLLKRDSRVLGRLVIDGNNLCNSGRGKNQKFVGLSALIALVPSLQKAWPGCEIIIVFDPGITGRLQLRWEQIQGQFPDSVNTHIVARGRSADEVIIELAQSPNTYIISNDRFGEFSGRPPVKENRVFGHDITWTSILVNELWISVNYSPPANAG